MNANTNSKIAEDTLPIALALYIGRPDIEKHQWDEHRIWRFISGTDNRHPYKTAECTFSDAVAAFLMGEVSDYFGVWVSGTLEQVANCNNGKVVEVDNETDIKNRSITVISQEELDILVISASPLLVSVCQRHVIGYSSTMYIANGFSPIGYISKVKA